MNVFIPPIAASIALMLLLAGCGSGEQTEGKRESLAGEGRAETSGIRNVENIGMPGNAVGAKVDHALDLNDQRKDELDRQLEATERSE